MNTPQKKGTAPLQFVAHMYCGKTAGWIKMSLGTKVGLGPRHIVLDGAQLPRPKKGKGTQPPQFSAHVYSGQTVARLSYCLALVLTTTAQVVFKDTLSFKDAQINCNDTQFV